MSALIRPEIEMLKFVPVAVIMYTLLAIEKLFVVWALGLLGGILILSFLLGQSAMAVIGVGAHMPFITLSEPSLVTPYGAWTPQWRWIIAGVLLAVLCALLSWFSNELAGEHKGMASPGHGARYRRGPRS